MNKTYLLAAAVTSLITLASCAQPQAAGSNAQNTGTAGKTDAKAVGNDQGNGADFLSDYDGSAWFTRRNNIIRACVQSSEDFGFSDSELKQKVSTAFQKWTDYMYLKNVTSFEVPSRFDLLINCDGTQDIEFLFGVSTPAVNSARARFENPIAFTVRTSYDQAKGWGKGFIYFAESGSVKGDLITGPTYPNWKLTGNLDIILLHEVGHVFGVGHVKGTIMDAEIAKFLNVSSQQKFEPRFHDIDVFQELIVCAACSPRIEGVLGVVEEVENIQNFKDQGPKTYKFDNTSDNFERLIGRKPVGSISANVSGSLLTSLDLTVTDSKGGKSFPITVYRDSRVESAGEPQFVSVTTEVISDGSATRHSYTLHNSMSYRGSLTTATGETIQLSIRRNMLTRQTNSGPQEGFGPFIQVHSYFVITTEEAKGTTVLFSREPKN